MKRLALVVYLLVLTAGPAGAVEPRPPGGGDFAYASPEQTFVAERTVVHWVGRGLQAPPLNDDDADAVPDYVEAVAAAAETALTVYERRGFRRPPTDVGGPDGRLDIYVSAMPFGLFGAMAPPPLSADGAFVVISSKLDRGEPDAIGSLKATVAHEVFHVIQHAYRFEHLPDWVLEGTADTMASFAAPESVEWLNTIVVRRWVEGAATPAPRNDPYGAALWWRFLEERDPGYLAAFLAERERRGPAAAGADPYACRLLDELHLRRSGTSINRRFQRFAAELTFDEHLARGVLTSGSRLIQPLGPLAIRAYRLKLPPGTRRLTLELRGRGAPEIELVQPTGRTFVGVGGKLNVSGDLDGSTIVLTGRANQALEAYRRPSSVRLRLSVRR